MMALLSCDPVPENGDDSLPSDEPTLQNPLLDDAARALEEARSADKSVSSIDLMTSGDGGYLVTFSDGSSILLGNSVKDPGGFTPLLAVGADGCWTVSYDGGQSSERILTETGQPLSAADVGVIVTVGEDGRFVFLFHTPGYPSKVTQTVRTSRSSSYSRVLQSSVKDFVRNVVTLTLADGSAYTLAMESASPRLLSLRIGTVEGVETEDGVFHIRLAYGTNVKALRPEYLTNGANVLVKDASHDFTAASTVNFSNPVTVRVVASNGESKDYTVVVHYSSLPVVYVTTPSAITSKDNWMEACGIQIWNAGGLNGTYADVQMKGRGNSTWGYAKKPYAIKLNKKAEVLGMKKHKRWCLLANYLDHTCMRNAVAFEIARQMPGLAWTPSGRFVDLVMNGEYRGNYYLCEQIKVDENRVDIAEIAPTDISGEAVTGGYLFELDTYYDEQFKFHTTYRYMPVQFKDPDEDIAAEQFDYVKDYFNKIEAILYAGAAGNVFDYIDLDSFIDWFLVNTLTGNREPKHPKSAYMNKDRGGKLKAGPVWDYDWETFIPNNEGLINTSDMWYDALFQNETFVKRLKERWNACKADVGNVEKFIDDTQAAIRESAVYNASIWPLGGYDVNGDGSLSFDAAVARLKQAFKQKIELNDKAINAL